MEPTQAPTSSVGSVPATLHPIHAKKAVYAKLVALQEDLKPILKTSNNPHFGNSYADINAMIEQVKPLLIKHKLSLTQPIRAITDGKMVLETIIVDVESGEQVMSSMYLPEILDPQKIGSAITYYRRYSLQSFLLLEAEDDDGNKASGKKDAPKVGDKGACGECGVAITAAESKYAQDKFGQPLCRKHQSEPF